MELEKLRRRRKWVVGTLFALNVWGNGMQAVMLASGAYKMSTDLMAFAIATSVVVWAGATWLVNRWMKRRESASKT